MAKILRMLLNSASISLRVRAVHLFLKVILYKWFCIIALLCCLTLVIVLSSFPGRVLLLFPASFFRCGKFYLRRNRSCICTLLFHSVRIGTVFQVLLHSGDSWILLSCFLPLFLFALYHMVLLLSIGFLNFSLRSCARRGAPYEEHDVTFWFRSPDCL
nr:MAG TPA_asm: hypothetical protein [Microviridae sp.]